MIRADEHRHLGHPGTPRPRHACARPAHLLDVLRATAAATPDALALEDPAGTVDYATLLDLVAARADDLATRGVRRGDRVGIRIPSGGRDLYVSILAVLAAGAAYVPSTPTTPRSGRRSCSARPGSSV